jgi:hypothetical protein
MELTDTAHGNVVNIMVSFQRRKVAEQLNNSHTIRDNKVNKTRLEGQDRGDSLSHVATSCYKVKQGHGTIYCLRLKAAQNGCRSAVSFVTRLRFHLIILHALTLHQMFVLCVKNFQQIQSCSVYI